MYSQTISPAIVTSNRRPKSPSQINVLPFGSRCAFEILGLKKSLSRLSRYSQTILLVARSFSMTGKRLLQSQDLKCATAAEWQYVDLRGRFWAPVRGYDGRRYRLGIHQSVFWRLSHRP